jgi:hypothetical protein
MITRRCECGKWPTKCKVTIFHSTFYIYGCESCRVASHGNSSWEYNAQSWNNSRMIDKSEVKSVVSIEKSKELTGLAKFVALQEII